MITAVPPGRRAMTNETPLLRWFEAYPRCPCGKAGNGILRGESNESYGTYCRKCAERRLRQSELVRKAEARAQELDPK